MKLRSRWMSGVLVALMGLIGCAGGGGAGRSYDPGSPAKAPAAESNAGDAAPSQPQGAPATAAVRDGAGGLRGDFKEEAKPTESPDRPGLGTTFGETRNSNITTSPFVRADSRSPFATAALFYNDEEGAKAMASASGFKRFSNTSVDLGGGVATARLKDGSGHFLNGFEAGGKKFAIGQAGERYTIVIQSNVPARLEVVVSVDGLDVLDGREASFGKRGYLIDPQGSIEIDGFRTSMNTVAAFRFGSVRDSYAEKKHGDSRNVGVIGVALFNEQGTNPATWPIGDTASRLNADPFPGKFATPP